MTRELIPLNESSERLELTNFKGEGLEKLCFISKVTQEECVEPEESIGHTISMVHWYVHRIEVQDPETNQIKPAVRTVLVDDNNLAYQFVSDGILSSLRTIVYAMGEGPYSPPIRVIPREGKSRRGRRFYYLQPLAADKPSETV